MSLQRHVVGLITTRESSEMWYRSCSPTNSSVSAMLGRTITVLRKTACLALILVFNVLTILSHAAYAGTCPPVGANTDCATVISIFDSGSVISHTGQGPYDTIEDTLIGVINYSRFPISSIVLQSPYDIFGFDGDGICGNSPITGVPYVPRPSGCPFGPTTYEGPGVSFSFGNTVNFNPPIPANSGPFGVGGPGTAYFSLEEDITQATTCSDIINGTVPKPSGGGTGISATFTPNFGYTLAQAAQLCGFTAWDWQQTVTLDPCADVFEVGSSTPLKAPYNDPPLKGYTYQQPHPNAVGVPVYYNLFVTNPSDPLYPLSVAGNVSPTGSGATTLSFSDVPADPCLSGSNNGSGKKLAFITHLVGIVGSFPAVSVFDTGIGFSYITTFNGTVGGISVRNGHLPVDPGSGTGNITVTNYNATTTYQYPKGLAVIAINGVPVTSQPSGSRLLTGSQISIVASGLAYSRVSNTFNGTITVKNVSSSAIAGPFKIVLDSLTPGVTLANATGTFGGWPYIAVSTVGSIAPGSSASVSVQFHNPANALINFSPLPYSGSFN